MRKVDDCETGKCGSVWRRSQCMPTDAHIFRQACQAPDISTTSSGRARRGREALHTGGRCARGDRGFQHYSYGVMLKRLQTVHVQQIGHEG